jgi:hypothetical protein
MRQKIVLKGWIPYFSDTGVLHFLCSPTRLVLVKLPSRVQELSSPYKYMSPPTNKDYMPH